jgi:hypothetical protein
MTEGTQGAVARVAEHVLGNLIVLFLAAAITYAFIAISTGSLPSPRIMVTQLEDRPYVVWHARATTNESYRRSNIFRAAPDKVIARYQILIENVGEATSQATKIAIETPYKVIGTRSFGYCECRHTNGNWVAVPASDQRADYGPRVEFRVPFLSPSDSVQLEVVLERSVSEEWAFPSTQVTFEGGASSMGLTTVADERWK